MPTSVKMVSLPYRSAVLEISWGSCTWPVDLCYLYIRLIIKKQDIGRLKQEIELLKQDIEIPDEFSERTNIPVRDEIFMVRNHLYPLGYILIEHFAKNVSS